MEKRAKNTGKLVNQLVCNDLKGLCGRMEKLLVAYDYSIRYHKALSNAVLNDIYRRLKNWPQTITFTDDIQLCRKTEIYHLMHFEGLQ